MGKILLEGMEFYAYHGHLKEEQIIGTRFLVDLEIDFDTTPAEQSDQLHDTINYQEAYQVIKKVMEVNSHLIEHVARRILDGIRNSFPGLASVKVTVSKIGPPVGGKVKQVSCVLTG
jgi:7,8-dihydroneopterin aldolase/epimerase/oxygenase